MTTETLQLLEEMNSRLAALSGLADDDLYSIQSAVIIVSEAIAKLRLLLTEMDFDSTAAEIRFFKKLKPQFDGKLIFYLILLRLQTPTNSTDQHSRYVAELESTQPFYEKYYSFWQYFQMGLTHFDEQYFTRQNTDEPLFLDEEQIHFDSRSNAPMSRIVARFYAYELLKDHAARLIREPQNGPGDTRSLSPLSWTSNKSELVELIFALHEYRAFNNGKLEVKKIADYFSAVFNIRFSNIYKTYEDIRLRKKSTTPFLDALRASLERRVDRDNENAM